MRAMPAARLATLCLLTGMITAPPLAAGAEGWETRASVHDRDRLSRDDAAFGTALRAALAAGQPQDIATLIDILTLPPQPIDPEALVGDWRCRTIKLGGRFGALTIYGFFQCRVTFGPDGLVFEKTTGSQRKYGDLYPDWTGAGQGEAVSRFIYLGSRHFSDEAPRGYDGRIDPTSQAFRDEIGYLSMPGPGRALLSLPWPARESDYDLIDLRR